MSIATTLDLRSALPPRRGVRAAMANRPSVPQDAEVEEKELSDRTDARQPPLSRKELPVIACFGCCVVETVKIRWNTSGYAALKRIECRYDNRTLIIVGIVSSYYFKQLA